MRLTAVALVLLAAIAAAEPKKGGKSVPYTSETGGYRASFPGKPRTEPKDVPTAAGVVRMTTDRAEGGGNLELAVTVAVYPDTFKDVAAKTLLDGVRDGLKGADGMLRTDEPVTLDVAGTTVTGREFRVEAGKNVVRCRAFLVGNRLYQVMATGSREAVAGKAVEPFFASFELLPDK